MKDLLLAQGVRQLHAGLRLLIVRRVVVEHQLGLAAVPFHGFLALVLLGLRRVRPYVLLFSRRLASLLFLVVFLIQDVHDNLLFARSAKRRCASK